MSRRRGASASGACLRVLEIASPLHLWHGRECCCSSRPCPRNRLPAPGLEERESRLQRLAGRNPTVRDSGGQAHLRQHAAVQHALPEAAQSSLARLVRARNNLHDEVHAGARRRRRNPRLASRRSRTQARAPAAGGDRAAPHLQVRHAETQGGHGLCERRVRRDPGQRTREKGARRRRS